MFTNKSKQKKKQIVDAKQEAKSSSSSAAIPDQYQNPAHEKLNTLKDELEKLTQCSVNLEPYFNNPDHSPYVLSCGHTLGKNAAEQIKQCPECRQAFKKPQPNYLVSEIITKFTAINRALENKLANASKELPIQQAQIDQLQKKWQQIENEQKKLISIPKTDLSSIFPELALDVKKTARNGSILTSRQPRETKELLAFKNLFYTVSS